MKLEFQHHSQALAGDFQTEGGGFVLKMLETSLEGKILDFKAPAFTLKVGERILRGYFFVSGDFVDVHLPDGTYRIRFARTHRSEGSSHGHGGLRSPMPGKVVKLLVAPGAEVQKGDLLMILEAMKMEHKILSPGPGIVKKIHFAEGDRVSQDVDLMEIES